MSHGLTVINFVGAMVGVLGVIIAIYLQLITREYCPPKYVILFLIFGVSMIMLNSSTIFSDHNGVLILQFAAYVILALSEISGAYYIWNQLDLNHPIQQIEDELFSEEEL